MAIDEALPSPALSDATEPFSALYENHGRAAYSVALRLTRDPVTADDAFQEAMLRAWRAAPSVRPGNHRGWMCRIVARECINVRKRNLACRRRVQNVAAPAPDISSRNSASAEQETLCQSLYRLLKRLPTLDQQLIKLCYEEGLSQRRISATLAVPQQTVSNRLKRAISHLRRELLALGLG
jgi:RNA polymerase sigma-70 factor (ECF subfamily)